MNLNELWVKLKHEFQRFVSPVGCTEPGNLMIVGESPSYTDIRTNAPLSDGAGYTLKRELERLGIYPIAKCYVTNVIKAQPDNNIIDTLIRKKTAASQVYESPIYIQYRQIIKVEIETLRPKAILALGNIALYTLTGYWGIYNYRGSRLWYVMDDGTRIPVIPTLHPSVINKQYHLLYYLINDLLKLKRVMDGTFLEPNYEITISGEFYKTIEYLNRIRTDGKYVAFDTEIYNEEVLCISLGYAKDYNLQLEGVLVIPFAKPTSGASGFYNIWTLDEEIAIWNNIAEIMWSPAIVKIAQNAFFDISMLVKHNIICRNVWDTMVLANQTHAEFDKDLGTLVSLYTDLPYYKSELKLWTKFNIDFTRFCIYNGKDSAVLFEITRKLIASLKRIGDTSYISQNRILEPLAAMHIRGMLINPEFLSVLRGKLNAEISDLKDELKEIAPDMNPGSPKQVKEMLYGEQKLRPIYDKKGSLSSNKKALAKLSAEGSELAEIISDVKKRASLLNTFVNMKLDDDGRLRCSFNPAGTSTGRLSTSKTLFGKGMNMQNLPKTFRSVIIPTPGYFIVEMDLSQAENRIVAWYAKCRSMMDCFNKNKDIHLMTAALIHELDYNNAEHIQLMTMEDANKRTLRDDGKQTNHGLNYRMSPATFSMTANIPLIKAKKFHAKYHSGYPEISAGYWTYIEAMINTNDGVVENPLGRRRRFIGRRDNTLYKSAYSWMAQSTVADIINKRGLLYIHDDHNINNTLLLLDQVHDSLVMEFKIPETEEQEHFTLTCLNNLKTNLESMFLIRGEKIQIPVDTKIGLNWGTGLVKVPCEKLQPITASAFKKVLDKLNNI